MRQLSKICFATHLKIVKYDKQSAFEIDYNVDQNVSAKSKTKKVRFCWHFDQHCNLFQVFFITSCASNKFHEILAQNLLSKNCVLLMAYIQGRLLIKDLRY